MKDGRKKWPSHATNAVLAPRAPNTVPDAPAAKAGARLAPLPRLKQHETMMANAENT